MIQKTIACLLACLFIGHFNSLEAQTNTQKESTYVGEQKNGQPEGKGVLTDTAGILVKKIKANFKALGPKYGKIMKQIAAVVNQFGAEDISELESNGSKNLTVDGQEVVLELSDVEISTQDIPGWLVANANGITVALEPKIL